MLRMKLAKTENVGNVTTRSYTVVKRNGQNGHIITFDDIKKVYDKTKKSNNNGSFMIRALNRTQWITIKGLRQDDVNLDELEEYYSNRVRESTNFTQFYRLQLVTVNI